jgi:OOP family OmpA-OmpF porin
MKKIMLVLLVGVLSVQGLARPFTTRQMRDDTIRINAMEVELIDEKVEKPVVKEEKKIIRLSEDKLFFDFDESRVKPEYYGELREVVKVIKDGGMRVSITGYTDSKGSAEYNEKLSLRRAEAVKEKLLEFGLADKDIAGVRGEGERNPIAPNTKPDGRDNPEGRAMNRRIEFELIR